LGVGVKDVVAEGSSGAASVRRGRGCPMPGTAGSSWLQLTPPQGAAEPSSQGGGSSGKAYVRKGSKHQTDKGGEEKSEKQKYEHQSKRSRAGGLQAPEKSFPCSPLGIPQ